MPAFGRPSRQRWHMIPNKSAEFTIRRSVAGHAHLLERRLGNTKEGGRVARVAIFSRGPVTPILRG
jgi:hypothetical protein